MMNSAQQKPTVDMDLKTQETSQIFLKMATLTACFLAKISTLAP